MGYIDKDKALNLDFKINVSLFESRRKTAERAVQAYADAISKLPAADVCPYYIGNKHDRGDDSLCRKAGCEVKAVRPVVTCGECKHWFENGTDYCSCDRDALLRERDFFCAAGEKREES